MGNIELKLNISRVDLIIACSVVVIAVILVVGFIIWLVKSSRQNRALKSIDKKLAYGKSVLTAEEENDICNRTSEQNESLKKEIERRDESEQCRKIVRDVIRDINININDRGISYDEAAVPVKKHRDIDKIHCDSHSDEMYDDIRKDKSDAEQLNLISSDEVKYGDEEQTKGDVKARHQDYIDEKLENNGEVTDAEVDVMAEINKMLKETENPSYESSNFLRYNTGKSGKTYTEEDLKTVIRD